VTYSKKSGNYGIEIFTEICLTHTRAAGRCDLEARISTLPVDYERLVPVARTIVRALVRGKKT
jgi:hypothetical protein